MDEVRVGVRAQIFFAVTLLIVFLVGVFVVWFPQRLNAEAMSALEMKAEGMTRVLATAVAPGLDFGDQGGVKEGFEGAIPDLDMAYLAVYTPSGQLIAGHQDAQIEMSEAFPRPKELHTIVLHDVVRVDMPVMTKAGAKGWLVVGLSTARIQRANVHHRNATLQIGLIMLLLGAAGAALLGTWLGRRMRTIAQLSTAVAQGRLDGDTISDAGRDELGLVAQNIDIMVRSMRILERNVGRIARGDLTMTIDQQGDLATALRSMVVSQRVLVGEFRQTATEIEFVSAEIKSSANEQAAGAQEQASVVEETSRTMDNLVASAQAIERTAQQVKSDAQATQGNQLRIGEGIAELAQHTDRITEILRNIREIAGKSELLALNAALEGTRAGDAGRGFSLVASQMQRLTESILGAVEDIRQLTEDIRAATNASILASEEGAKRSSTTYDSAARITLVSRQQRTGTEQVTTSMNELTHVIHQVATSSAQSRVTAERLSTLAGRLNGLVSRYQLNGEPTSGK